MTVMLDDVLSRFDAADVHHLPGGHVVVAGEYVEPMQRIPSCLVDYVSPELAAAPDAADVLVAWAKEAFPAAKMLLVRLTDEDASLLGFEDYLFYMMLTKPPTPHADETPIDVRPARPEDLEFVGSFLVEAFDDGLEMRLLPAEEDAGTKQARTVLKDPDARSFVASCDGENIGHATLLVNQADQVTGQEFVELLDFLVERKHPMRYPAESALVTHTWKYAQDLGLPVLSHIVVREKTCHCAGVELMILDRLYTRGWEFSHKYQRYMFPAS
ncbi:hypothetical protein [Actinomadura rayongensis]|uniref:N-acetyltransferase domain-containing protein n=1 Tax=Actinomadura rayongensis TaxID=1429076 RepID=A0A6I4WGY0_9ACTN|nr:hypothetical protein [Actinomadura rayongensis]MXQ66264.1 hypothetical protein [Actinomadura rayongensis]